MFPGIFTFDLNANLRKMIFRANIKIFLGTWLEAMDFISIFDIRIWEFLFSDKLQGKGNQYGPRQTRVYFLNTKSLKCLNSLIS